MHLHSNTEEQAHSRTQNLCFWVILLPDSESKPRNQVCRLERCSLRLNSQICSGQHFFCCVSNMSEGAMRIDAPAWIGTASRSMWCGVFPKAKWVPQSLSPRIGPIENDGKMIFEGGGDEETAPHEADPRR